ncbi:DUF2336 domain-containing protein [Sphingomonas abietis]|uniref:DUF2336 domain-containing protein n=1 Tax=Sphingomonas abietis TaxID=3012344 RepID=A0ABY7NQ40_9SPHN|nr:DUF2336 domain-containing protein [Sphingomonas abietis]WBO23659.1 DUF2336 domain-containing protein [Sphingomonas abietis]
MPPHSGSQASGDALLSAAHGAEALLGDRVAAAGVELARPPAFGIDDEMRARAGQLIRSVIDAAEIALRSAEPSFDSGRHGDLGDRFVAVGLLARSGLAAAALLRAEEYRLAAALVRGAGEDEGPGAHRLDPIGGEFAAESFAVRAAEAARIERTGDPLLPLHDVPAEDRHALFWQVAACLSDRALAEGAAEDALHRTASAAVARALASIDDGEGIAPAAMRLAHRLDSARQLDDPLLAGTLAAGRVASLASMLAVRAGIPFDDARAMMTDAARFAVLLRACDVARGIAAAMVLALALALDRGFGPDPAEAAASLIEGYTGLPVERARAEVRRARLEPHYRDALAALAGRG